MIDGEVTKLVHSAMCIAHRKLVDMGLKGEQPILNVHHDSTLPTVVYQPRTNALACCASKLRVMLRSEIESAVMDAMAMCGCQRSYEADKRLWNYTQNKVRMTVPALSMHGSPKWRHIRSKL